MKRLALAIAALVAAPALAQPFAGLDAAATPLPPPCEPPLPRAPTEPPGPPQPAPAPCRP
jgi:hypothetical protein